MHVYCIVVSCVSQLHVHVQLYSGKCSQLHNIGDYMMLELVSKDSKSGDAPLLGNRCTKTSHSSIHLQTLVYKNSGLQIHQTCNLLSHEFVNTLYPGRSHALLFDIDSTNH